jgi:hypothetical protein
MLRAQVTHNQKDLVWTMLIKVERLGGGTHTAIVDAFLEAPITSKEPAVVLSGQARTVRGTGPDGPRHRAGRSATWREAAVLSGQAWTVRGTGPDGPRPGAGARVPCLTAGQSAP